MNDPIKEQLSAFLDGELPPAETELLLRRFDRDAASLETQCARYRLIGDALRGAGDRVPSSGFAGRVHGAVASETIPTSRRREVGRSAPGWLRPVAGVGIAAGVAAVFIPDVPDVSVTGAVGVLGVLGIAWDVGALSDCGLVVGVVVAAGSPMVMQL